ncbi:hypothetical protein LJC29_03340 [Bacteroides sp. OttesenSCG-928-N06]|nr:hypothetical protein [Bacteroides sp. OttesenSCG-928-N06]
MKRKTIKRAIITFGIIAGFLILNKFFILPYSTLGFSEDIAKSKKVNAFMYECEVIKIDTFQPGYTFPITTIWVEKPWFFEHNRWGLVVPKPDPNPRYERVVFDIVKDDTFFIRKKFSEEWVIRDSLSGRVGFSNAIINLDWHYTKGDTAIFNIYKLQGTYPSIWIKEDLIPIFRFEIIAR